VFWSILAALGLSLVGVGLTTFGALPGVLSVIVGALIASGCGTRAIWVHRVSRDPPIGLRLDDQGLTMYQADGGATRVPWLALQAECSLAERSSLPTSEFPGRYELVPQNGSTSILQYVLLRQPMFPATFLTPEAFQGILRAAEKSGVRLAPVQSS
jgi:hypothetical protein